MTDGGPRDRDGTALEDLQQHRDVVAFPTSLLSGHLLRMVAKRPAQLEVRGDAGRSSCIVLEGRDRDTVEDPRLRCRAGAQIAFQGKESLQQAAAADFHRGAGKSYRVAERSEAKAEMASTTRR